MAGRAKKYSPQPEAKKSFEDLPDLVARRNALADEVSLLESRVGDLHTDLEVAQKSFESARAEIAEEISRAQVSHKADEAEGNLRKARVELEIAKLEGKKAGTERNLDLIRLQLEHANNKSEEVKNQLAAEQERLKEILALVDVARSALESTETELGSRKLEVDARTADLGRIQESIEKHRINELRLTEEIAKLALEQTEKSTKLSELSAQIEKASQKRQEMDDRTAAAAKLLEETQKAQREVDTALEEIRATHEKVLRDISQTREEQEQSIASEWNAHKLQLQQDRDRNDSEMARRRDEAIESFTKEAAAKSEEMIGKAREQAVETLAHAEKQAETTRAQAASDYKSAVQEALEAKAEALALKSKADLESRQQIEGAKDRAADLLKEARTQRDAIVSDAESNAAEITGAVQADYDAKMSEAERIISGKRAEMESEAQSVLQDAQNRAKETLGKAQAEADGINGDVDRIRRKAQLDAQGVLEKAKADTEVMKTKTDTYLQSVRKKADEEYDLKRREMDAKIAEYREKKEAAVTRWEQEQMESFRASRKRHVEEAARTVVQLVEKQLAANTKIVLKANESSELFDEIDRSVRATLNNDNAAVKEKLKKLMVDPGVKAKSVGIKLKKETWIGIAVGAVAVCSLIGFFIIQHLNRNTASSDSYVARVGEERRAARIYNPTMSPEYKSTYTDNVLFTTGFVKTELDTRYQDKWIVSLNRFVVHKLDLDDRIVVSLVPLETGLLRRLEKMRAQISPSTEKTYIEKMREAEEETLNKMEKVLGGQKNLQVFLKHKRAFYEENATK